METRVLPDDEGTFRFAFYIFIKRIDRLMDCIPDDWGNGYDNVTVGCTVENQAVADYRLSIFRSLLVKHKNIVCQPLLEKINIEHYLDDIELVVVGGESDYNARQLNYDWVLSLRDQCKTRNMQFEFRQCGTHFVKDNKKYTLNVRQLCSQARKANINF